MSLVSEAHKAIDSIIQPALPNSLQLVWIPLSNITDIKPSQIDSVYYAGQKSNHSAAIVLILLGSEETCTPTFVSEFARIYSLPTHNCDNDGSQFRRYATLLKNRNKLIIGF